MEAAAKGEAHLAMAADAVDEAVFPLIAVVTYGAWCKRLYGNYNTMSGVLSISCKLIISIILGDRKAVSCTSLRKRNLTVLHLSSTNRVNKNVSGDVPVVLRETLSDRLQHLCCVITGAIKYRKSQVGINEEQHIRDLRNDIHNGPSHVFGDYSKCPARGYFCNGSRSEDECIVPNIKSVGMWDEIMSENNTVLIIQKVSCKI
ncbi:hypothetical protein PR048_023634 [Dryococelus australis]|uniref:Uncharacterized protein n=1 Tax=Dryococelus australis TaxID=614101 RepID=A0ABQ9GUM6_9NEOP|nr:hypothetical protein PR048_023634 [Dryococelus australis]